MIADNFPPVSQDMSSIHQDNRGTLAVLHFHQVHESSLLLSYENVIQFIIY
jgi:hypothetical protein